MTINSQFTKALMTLGAACTTLLLGGCWHCEECEEIPPEMDIVYSWNIPSSDADCPKVPVETFYTDSTPGSPDLDGGTGIVDRDGGTGIVDRGGAFVTTYCYRKCAGTEVPTGPTIVDWHNPSDFVVAYRGCKSIDPGD